MIHRPHRPRASSSRVRLYSTLRTAHLERAHQLQPATIVYLHRRYDFDEDLIVGLDLIQTSPLPPRAAVLGRSRVEVLEINEPLMVSSLRMTALAVAVVRVRGLLARHRTDIVSYAIGNLDPWATRRAGARQQVRQWIDRRLASWVWGQLDRICFGTEAARDVYRHRWPDAPGRANLILALPAPLDGPGSVVPGTVVFLGDLSPRKGVDRVLAAWPLVRQSMPEARLRVIGKGGLEPEVRTAADDDDSVEVVIDPPRPAIQDELRRAQVLALPSQPTGSWREQVGLPIVEGLAAGCSIVTTTETGLAGWLEANGHAVIPPGSAPGVLAGAIVDQLARARTFAEVTTALPAVDGRLAADAWLFGGSDRVRSRP